MSIPRIQMRAAFSLCVFTHTICILAASLEERTPGSSEEALQCDVEGGASCVQETYASLLQTQVLGVKSSEALDIDQHEPGDSKGSEKTAGASLSFSDLFPTSQLENLDDAFAAPAVAAAVVASNYSIATEELRMFNPSVFQDADGSTQLLARVTNQRHCCGSQLCNPKDAYAKQFKSVVKCKNESGVVQCSKPILDVDDPHVFNMNGRFFALLNTYDWNSGNPRCKIFLLDLMTDLQTPLHLPNAHSCEKNWSPFLSNGELFMTYGLSPEHSVLHCEMPSGSCRFAFNSTADFSRIGLPIERNFSSLRGGAPYAELDSEHFVAVAHMYTDIKTKGGIRAKGDTQTAREYWHSFYSISRRPPFSVTANTPWFRFPNLEADAGAEWLCYQYAGGLMRMTDSIDNSSQLVVSFGVGDCHSRSLRLPASHVQRALQM